MTIQTNCEICKLPALGAVRCKGCNKRSCPRCLVVEKFMCRSCAARK